jgi:hypothetical protein
MTRESAHDNQARADIGLGDARIPAVQRHGDTVMLHGLAVLDAHYLIALGVRDVVRRDGIQPSPRLRQLLDVLARTAADIRAVSPAGHGDVPHNDELRQSTSLDPISTKEAAVILGLSERQVRRVADDIGVHRGAVLTFHRAAVEAYAYHRQGNS